MTESVVRTYEVKVSFNVSSANIMKVDFYTIAHSLGKSAKKERVAQVNVKKGGSLLFLTLDKMLTLTKNNLILEKNILLKLKGLSLAL